MKIKNHYLILIITILALGMSCSNKDRSAADAGSEVKKQTPIQEDSSPMPGFGRNRRQKPPGLGLGRRNRRVWQPTDVVHLSKEEIQAIDVQTAAVKRMSLQSHLEAMGKVLEHQYRKAIVSYAFSARIAERHVKIGDWVKKGQELITLQSEEVGNAMSEFYKAGADYELARVNHERDKRLFDRGVGAKKDYLATDAVLKVAQANLNAAEKKLHVLGFNEQQVRNIAESHQINPVITLYAPLNGKIIHDNAVLGAMIDQTFEIMTIMDPSFLHIDAEIYEKDIAKIRNGQKVQVTVPAYPDESFNGKISYISDVLSSETRTITVRTEVDNRDFKLKPGMFADMKIFLGEARNVLVIPKEAVLDEMNDHIVFLQQDDHFVPVLVQLGDQQDGHIEILQGLKEGDIVVTNGSFQLKSKLYDQILQTGHIH